MHVSTHLNSAQKADFFSANPVGFAIRISFGRLSMMNTDVTFALYSVETPGLPPRQHSSDLLRLLGIDGIHPDWGDSRWYGADSCVPACALFNLVCI